MPMASSLAPLVGAVAPDATLAAPLVVPVAWEVTSTAAVPEALERPEYSEAMAPTSALALGVTVIAGLVPPPAVIGAVHTLSSVLSDPVKCRTSV